VVTHAITVAPDVDDVTVVDHPVGESASHSVIAMISRDAVARHHGRRDSIRGAALAILFVLTSAFSTLCRHFAILSHASAPRLQALLDGGQPRKWIPRMRKNLEALLACLWKAQPHAVGVARRPVYGDGSH